MVSLVTKTLARTRTRTRTRTLTLTLTLARALSRCARGDEHATAACALRPKLLHSAWPGLRTFAQEVMGLDDAFLNTTRRRR